ncbi:MAG: hypothetical protein AAF799_32695 [Myxococcota bacterium]
MSWIVVASISTLGSVLWVITYGLIALRARRDRQYGMPLAAISVNIGWELTWGFLRVPVVAGGVLLPVVVWAQRVWFLVDLVLLAQVVVYGWSARSTVAARRRWVVTVLAWLVFGFIAQWECAEFFEDVSGQRTAFIANGVTSLSFLLLLRRRPGLGGLSMTVAWTKMLGSAFVCFSYLWLFPMVWPQADQTFHYVLYVTIFGLDVLYIVRLGQRRAQLRRSR